MALFRAAVSGAVQFEIFGRVVVRLKDVTLIAVVFMFFISHSKFSGSIIKCPFSVNLNCGKCFLTKKTLECHLATHRPQEHQFRCELCDNRFTRNSRQPQINNM